MFVFFLIAATVELMSASLHWMLRQIILGLHNSSCWGHFEFHSELTVATMRAMTTAATLEWRQKEERLWTNQRPLSCSSPPPVFMCEEWGRCAAPRCCDRGSQPRREKSELNLAKCEEAGRRHLLLARREFRVREVDAQRDLTSFG